MKRNVLFARTLRAHATAYFELGFNIAGIMEVGKGPYHPWKEFMSRRQTRGEALNHPWSKLCGVGAIAGINDLGCLDYDQCHSTNIPMFLEKCGLPMNYEWVVISGSGRGFHIWFRSTQLSSVKKKVLTFNSKTPGLFKQIELRVNAHVVLPPSIHRSGEQYRFWQSNNLTSPPKMID